jgi:hypothetical protein
MEIEFITSAPAPLPMTDLESGKEIDSNDETCNNNQNPSRAKEAFGLSLAQYQE